MKLFLFSILSHLRFCILYLFLKKPKSAVEFLSNSPVMNIGHQMYCQIDDKNGECKR